MNFNGFGIYKIENDITNKVYIGSTSRSFEARWREHKSDLRRNVHANPELQRDWTQCGEDNFSFRILERISRIDELIELEQKWLDYYNLINSTYNMGVVAEHPRRGIPLSEEHKQRIRETKIGRKNPMYGRDFTAEHRENLSRALTGRKWSDETRQKLHGLWLGREHQESSKKKMRISALKRSPYFGRPFPAMENVKTGEVVSAGDNVTEFCMARGLQACKIWRVVIGERLTYKGWRLVNGRAPKENKPPVFQGAPYPAFLNLETGEVIPEGKNLRKLCRQRNLNYIMMNRVKRGVVYRHKDWILLKGQDRKELKLLGMPYPSFYHKETGEIIPAGVNVSRMCRERNLNNSAMCSVIKERLESYKGWKLLEDVSA